MRIRTQFITGIAILGGLLLLVLAAAIVTDQKVARTDRLESLATKIEGEAYQLSYLTNDYLVYRGSQQAGQWESTFTNFSNDLAQFEANSGGQQILLADIIKNQQQLNSMFAEIKTSFDSAAPQPAPAFDAAFLKAAWARMETQNQAIISDASSLRGLLGAQDDQLRRATDTTSFILIGIFGLFLLLDYWWIYQRILKAMAGLQAGARTIGAGQLDFSIPVKSRDEIGDLAQAFNQMAADLKRVTASKADLEKEILEREQAETALLTSQEEVQRHLEALGSANTELSAFNRTMVGRELRMIELKKEVDELRRQAGQPARYHPRREEQPD